MAPKRGRGKGRPPGQRPKPSENKNKNRPCLQFQKGKCNYGEKCKLSHDTGGVTNERPSRSSDSQPDPEARAKYYEWKRLLRQNPYESHGSDRIEDTLKFWQGALTILKGENHDQYHIIAKELVDDKFNGPAWINATTKMTSFTSGINFECAETFLRVISHHSLAPLSISPFVGTIYDLFGGTGGEQGIEFLLRMCAKVKWTTGTLSITLDPEICDIVDVILKVLNDLLTKTTRVQFHDEVPKLITSLDDLLGSISQRLDGAFCDGLRTRLDIIKRIVAGSTARMVTVEPSSDKKASKKSVTSSFPKEMAMPGGRHDNDFPDIWDISILPTQGEITSEHAEYLPSTNFLHPHVLDDPMQRYIDSTFRLVRHDILGPVNDVLRGVLTTDNVSIGRASDKNSQAQVYTSSKIRHISVSDKQGLEAIVCFLAPPFIRKMSATDQRDWWQRSPRLGEGTLVCFVASEAGQKKLLFLQVTLKNTQQNRERPDPSESSLVSRKTAPSITAKLAIRQQGDLALLIRLSQDDTTGVLIDFNGVIPDTFIPILKNLQKIQRENHIAFQEWILPTPDKKSYIPPPLYARKPGFSFPLGCIAKDKNSQLKLDPSLALGDINLKKIEKETGLDHGQCLGLVEALTSEYALIQGPPGTGKSYLGVQLVRALLAVKEPAKLGPILIICYTNRALDQFLKHLLDVGIEAIIRIGGRSIAEELDSKNLRVVSKETQKTGVERCILGEAYAMRETSLESADKALRPLFQTHKGPSWGGLQRYLFQKHPKIHKQLKLVDEGGFKTVTKDPLKTWLRKRPKQITTDTSTCRALIRRAEGDINSLSLEERWLISEYWLEQQSKYQLGLLFESLDDAEEQRETVQRTHDAVDQRTLARADVIGITTTSLAKQLDMLRSLKIKCVMCEEAGELREADIISALMQDVEHFIQIGDHKQLRPQINNFELSLESSSGKRWQLDRSQFERRAVGEPGLDPVPFAQLNVQRRMRPEISKLIRRVYPNLKDHESVHTLPDVVGMRRNLFWLDHNHPEEAGGDGTRVKSHSNRWETDMATALVRHIVRQGVYKTEDIALLTPYTGQLQQLRAALSKDFQIWLSDRDMDQLAQEGFEDESKDKNGEGLSVGAQKMIEKKQILQTIRLATVDNFQGEEAKIIIVSLVRSNRQRKVGFLRTENRINVLLSRAQHGMYLIGNSKTYLNGPMWSDVYKQLSQAGSVGNKIELCCPRHKDVQITCAEPEDFEIKSPEGGCTHTCSRQLEPCGHKCLARCHSNKIHEAISCQQPCNRVRETCDHQCRNLCGEPCGLCKVEVRNVELPCGHFKPKLMCHNKSDLSSIKCTAKTEKVIRACGHSVTVECCTDVNSKGFSHPHPCLEILPCGHQCTEACSSCRQHDGRVVHGACTEVCDRPYSSCNHRCPQSCHDGRPCDSCNAPCEVQCPHSACTFPCNKECAPCIEKCTWSCQHQQACTLPCSEPCNRLPCDKRCTKKLCCGHQCPSFCGEDCPTEYCQECGDKGDVRVDLLDFRPYAKVDLDESPIVVLGCGHLFTGKTLDDLLGLDEVYTRNDEGNFDSLRRITHSFSKHIPFCPDCKRPIRQFATKRYSRLMNRAVMDDIWKRLMVNGRKALNDLESQLQAEEKKLNSSRASLSAIKHNPQTAFPKERYKVLAMLSDSAESLTEKMSRQLISSKCLLDHVATASLENSRLISLITTALSLLSTEPYKQIIVEARLISFKAAEVQLQDFVPLIHNWTQAGVNDAVVKAWLGEQSVLAKGSSLLLSQVLIREAGVAILPRMVVSASLSFAKMCLLSNWQVQRMGVVTDKGKQGSKQVLDLAEKLLTDAKPLCEGFEDSHRLKERVQEMLRLFEPQYYDTIVEELASVKLTMISGSDGIGTRSGHWYRCTHGHSVVIGECGITVDVEVARCPVCGARIGGNHSDKIIQSICGDEIRVGNANVSTEV